MKCPLCNNDLHIAASFLESRLTETGEPEIYSVIDLACSDTNCLNGKRKLPIAREARRVETATNLQNAVTCCGHPLVYLDGADYWVPDGVAAAKAADGATITVTCTMCGRRHELALRANH